MYLVIVTNMAPVHDLDLIIPKVAKNPHVDAFREHGAVKPRILELMQLTLGSVSECVGLGSRFRV